METISIYLENKADFIEEFEWINVCLEYISRRMVYINVELSLIDDAKAKKILENKDYDICSTVYFTGYGACAKAKLEGTNVDFNNHQSLGKLLIFFKHIKYYQEKETPPEVKPEDKYVEHYGPIYCHFEDEDIIEFELLTQITIYNSSTLYQLMRVDNTIILIGEQVMIGLLDLPFAALNDDFSALSQQIDSLDPKLYLKERKVILTDEDMDAFTAHCDNFQQKKKDFLLLQENLLNTAINIRKVTHAASITQLQDAIDCFNAGQVSKAHIHLKKIRAQHDEAFDRLKHIYERFEEESKKLKSAYTNGEVLPTSFIFGNFHFNPHEFVKQAEANYVPPDETDIGEKLSKEKLRRYKNNSIAFSISEAFNNAKPTLEESQAMMVFVDAAMLQSTIALCDFTLSLDERLEHATRALIDGAKIANYIKYNRAITVDLELNYVDFLNKYKNGAWIEDAEDCRHSCEYYFGPINLRTIRAFCQLARAYKLHWKALEYYRLVLERGIKILGPCHADMANLCDAIGDDHLACGYAYEATVYYEQALDVRRDIMEFDCVDLTISFKKLYLAYDILGDKSQAEKYKEWASKHGVRGYY